MAYIDQDRSREKTISGAISLAVIGVVGYGLASGLAMRIVRETPWVIPTDQWQHPLPPPEKKMPPRHVEKTTQARPEARPQDPQPQTQDTPLDASHSEIVPTTTVNLGKAATTIELPPPPPTVDHSSGASPRGRPGDWVSSEDYPSSAVRAGIEGRTGFRLDVNADGKPTACTVVASSGSDQLDRAACDKIMRRARFTPAHDAAGNPIGSTYSNGVAWKLPAE